MTLTRKDCLRILRENFSASATRDLMLELFETQPEEKIPGKEFEGQFAIAAQMVLKSGYTTGGALTVRPDGLLHMAQPAQLPNPVARSAPPIISLAHHYFSLFDIEAVIVVDTSELRRLTETHQAPTSRIVT